MQVDRHVQPCGPLEDRPEALVVEEDAVGEAVDHAALETKLDGALQLVGGGRRVRRRQRRESGKALGMSADGRMQAVVDLPRERDRAVAGQLLGSGRAVRDDLHVDAGLVHFLQAQLAQVVEAPRQLGIACAVRAGVVLRQSLVPVVLLQRDDLAPRPLQHERFLPVGWASSSRLRRALHTVAMPAQKPGRLLMRRVGRRRGMLSLLRDQPFQRIVARELQARLELLRTLERGVASSLRPSACRI